jgi:hypothetical protein
VVRLTPRLEGHSTARYIRGAPIVPEFVYQRISIGDLTDPDLALLEGGDSRKH